MNTSSSCGSNTSNPGSGGAAAALTRMISQRGSSFPAAMIMQDLSPVQGFYQSEMSPEERSAQLYAILDKAIRIIESDDEGTLSFGNTTTTIGRRDHHDTTIPPQ